MDDQNTWDAEDLLRALDGYEDHLNGRALSPSTVESDIRYCGLFLRWRTGGYGPRACPTPTGPPVPAGKRVLAQLRAELEQYRTSLLCGVKASAVPTYGGPPRRFLDFVGGEGNPIGLTPKPSRVAISRPSALSSVGLVDTFALIRNGHRAAVVRTVARMTLLPSVTRVFEKGTGKDLSGTLMSLPVDELPELADQGRYRIWFEAALDSVARTILQCNPPGPRTNVHPEYKWGHATKVLCLFVRNLSLCSRYFTEEEARRVEPWLYCPIDSIVMAGLRRADFNPGAQQINAIDEAAFWRIQDALSVAAETAGVPRVWFDDVWSEERD